MLKYTKSFSISSHPTSDGVISGFDRSYNLAQYLLQRHPDVSILLHVTCYDLNRVNINARLTLLRSLGVRRILVITGQQYNAAKLSPNNEDLLFKNSCVLLRHIKENYSQWFELVATAAYPQVHGSSEYREVKRLVDKSMDGFVGAFYTQCLFSVDELEPFFSLLAKRLPSIQLVPSIALFNSVEALEKSIRLTGVRIDSTQHQNLIDALFETQHSFALEGSYSKVYLERLCDNLRLMLKTETLEINICPFGLFNFAADLIEFCDKMHKSCSLSEVPR